MKIVIYEDKDSLRQHLSLLLGGMEGFEVIGAFPDCRNVKAEMSALRPDVVLMDIDMPEVDGIEGVKRIKSHDTSILVVMHTVFDDDDKLFASLQAGADGYLLKKTSPVKLIEALQDIHNGGAPMSPAIARRVLDTFHGADAGEQYGLTEREIEILRLLTQGYTYKAIAAECFISMDTVSTHLRHVYQKLHVKCATAAVAKAIMEKLV